MYVSLSIRDTGGGLFVTVISHLLPQWGPSATSAIGVIWPLLIGLVHFTTVMVLLLVHGRLEWLLLLLLVRSLLLLLVLTGIDLLLLLLLCLEGA